jgi:hypothetical protein
LRLRCLRKKPTLGRDRSHSLAPVGSKTFDALVFGYYEDDRPVYAARTRNGFTPVVREQLFKSSAGWKSRIVRS